MERMKEFRQRLLELRSAEKHPFNPSSKTMKQVHTSAWLYNYCFIVSIEIM